MNNIEQFEQRCKTVTDSLPQARYREHLERLHRDMLEALAQPAQQVNTELLDSLREVVAYCEESGIDWMCLITARTAIDAAERTA